MEKPKDAKRPSRDEKKDGEEDESQKKTNWFAWLALFLGLIFGAFLMYMFSVLGDLEDARISVFIIFVLSMLIGISGAMVYLVVQMLSERGATTLEHIMKPYYGVPSGLMTASFVLSGGLVAGFTQASVGSFAAGNIWTVFLIGFGWQGAMMGIGSSSSVMAVKTEVREEAGNKVKNTEEELRSLMETVEKIRKDMRQQLEDASNRVRQLEGSNDPLGEVIGGN